MRDARIGAVVGYDPSFIARRFAPTITGAPLFSPARSHAPVLEFHRADTTVTMSVLDTLARVPRYSVELRGPNHIDFNSYTLVFQHLLQARAQSAGRRLPRDSALVFKAAAYEGVVRATERFLGHYLGANARQFGGVPSSDLRKVLDLSATWPAAAAPHVTPRRALPGTRLGTPGR
jgi:hypothetical protein